jgi:hypothetical protein
MKEGGRTLKRVVLGVVGILVAVILAAPAVSAQPNGGAPQPIDETPVPLPAGSACEFEVLLEQTGKTKAIELNGGRTISIFPGNRATLTNVDTGKRVTLNIPGSFEATVLENGDVLTVLRGRNLALDPEAGFVLTIGRFSFAFDKKNNLIQPLSGKGKLVDVCGLLS